MIEATKNVPPTESESKEEVDNENEEKQEKQENRVLDDNKNETQVKNDAKECEANGTIPNPTLDPDSDKGQCPRNKSAPALAHCNLLSVGKWFSLIFSWKIIINLFIVQTWAEVQVKSS